MVRVRMRVAAGAVLAAAACGVSEPLRVERIQIGRSLNSDRTVGVHTTQFKPDDTIYVSILNQGPGRGVVAVRWFYAGQSLGESSRRVSYRSSDATEFHFRESGGFPSGPYRVEILVDGEVVGEREFRVE